MILHTVCIDCSVVPEDDRPSMAPLRRGVRATRFDTELPDDPSPLP